jgi:tetratricopeptide (TPR) repeat protein
MGRYDDHLDEARAALEEYDYERTAEAFSQAYQAAKKVKPAFLEEYLGFLVDLYGGYERAREVLEDEPKALARSARLQKLLARARYFGEDFDGALAIIERYRDALRDDDEVGVMHGRVLIRRQELARAREVLMAVLGRTPGHTDARKLVDQCDAELSRQTAGQLDGLDALIEGGDLDQAQALVDEVLAVDPRASKAHQYKKLLAECRVGRRVDALLEQASAHEAEGRHDECLRALEEAHELEPARSGLSARLEAARAKVFEAMCCRMLDRAEALHGGGDPRAAAQALVELTRVPNAERSVANREFQARPLLTLVQEIRAAGTASLDDDVTLDALVALYHMEQDGSAATRSAGELKKLSFTLGELPRLSAWIHAAESRAEASRRARLEASYAEAVAAEEAGRLDEALKLLKGLSGYKDTDERVTRLNARREREERTELAIREIERALEEERVFDARRAAGNARRAGLDCDRLSALHTAVDERLESGYSALPAIPITDDPWERFPIQGGAYARLGDDHLVVLGEGAMLVWNITEDRDDGVWDLPAAFSRERGHYRLFARGEDALMLVDWKARAAALMEVRPGHFPTVIDRFSLDRLVPDKLDQWRVSLSFSPDAGTLLILASHIKGERKPTLRGLDLGTLKQSFETEFGFHVFRQIPVQGKEAEYGLSRMYVNSSNVPFPRWDFALTNERGRVARSLRFGQAESVHGIRRMIWEPELGKYFASFDYFDPFSGQIGDESMGLAILEPDLNPYFFESRMEDKLSAGHYVVGDVTVLPEIERLVMPYRDRERRVGLAVFPILSPGVAQEIEVGQGDLILDLLPKGDGSEGQALVYDREKKGGRLESYRM